MEMFDPYRKWLGIPPEEQPPDHYRLLGVGRFESDTDAISNAADRQMAHVRNFRSGEDAVLSQRILNELSAARVCLLDSQRKAEYDAQLRRRQAAGSPVPPQVAPPPQPPPGGMTPPVSAPPAVREVATGRKPLFSAARSRGYSARRRHSSWWISLIALAVALGSLALLAWALND